MFTILMILGIALHKPKGPNEEAAFLNALREYGDLQRKHKGHLYYGVGKDEPAGLLIVTTVWATKEDMMAASGEMQKFLGTFDFKANQEGPTKYWSGEGEFAEFGSR
jgi:antibiotic biosynthesis monooxygenase